MAPRERQEGPKRASRRPQDGSKSLPRRVPKQRYVSLTSRSPKKSPRPPQDPPKEPQEAPKRPQRRPKRPKEAPKRPPGGPKRPPRGPKTPPRRPKRPHLQHKNEHFVWEGSHFSCVLPSCVQYVAVRPPPGPRSAGFNPPPPDVVRVARAC